MREHPGVYTPGSPDVEVADLPDVGLAFYEEQVCST
jgi:hypothetical protein